MQVYLRSKNQLYGEKSILYQRYGKLSVLSYLMLINETKMKNSPDIRTLMSFKLIYWAVVLFI